MPCDTITTAEVEIGKLDPKLLSDAMLFLGVVRYTYANGKLEMQSRNDVSLAQVKVAYSRAVVLSQARKYGWKVKETQPNRFEVNR